MKTQGKQFAIAILLAFSVGSANATFISADLSTPGDGKITIDSASDLQWLDVTETIHFSYNSIIAGDGGFTSLLGFRYATQAEVDALFVHAGLNASSIENFVPGSALMALLGPTFGGGSTGFFAITGTPYPLNPTGAHEVASMQTNGTGLTALSYFASAPDSFASYSIGSFLVRDASSVPEPGSVSLLFIGLAGLGFLRRRKI